MTDTPKFEVIDRRKLKKDEEQESGTPHSAPEQAPEPEKKSSGPRLVETESAMAAEPEASSPAEEEEFAGEMPPLPSPQEMREQAAAYDASAQRVEDLMRAQNPTL